MERSCVGHRTLGRIFEAICALTLSAALAACGGGNPTPPLSGAASTGLDQESESAQIQALIATYSIGGKVDGIETGKFIVLRNNNGSPLTVSANGPFTFPESLPSGANYNITIATSPAGQTCELVRPSGTVQSWDIRDIRVFCAPSSAPSTYTVGGATLGLGAGKSMVLQTPGANNLTITANGAFTFSPALLNGSTYAVTVATQPSGQNCTVNNGSGTLSGANVTNIAVNCANVNAGLWSSLQTPNDEPRALIIRSSEPLLVNAPFYGLEVRKNGVDITDDIVNIVPMSSTSWKFVFGSQVMNTPGDTITASLQNAALATPGHFVTVREAGNSVQQMYQRLQTCQNSGCEGRPPVPGLLAAIKGMSKRYEPRDIETRQTSGAASQYDFSEIFSDAAFLATKGMKLHVMFTVKSFATDNLYNGNGSNRFFNIPSQWDKGRNREVHVYLKNSLGKYVETRAYTINRSTNPARVEMNSAPATGNKNVLVSYARDPFPDYVWQMNPPIASWYEGVGGGASSNTGAAGSHGHVYAPWRSTCVTWLRSFMGRFQRDWTAAINAGTVPATAIESISIQETANPLGDEGFSTSDPTYTPAGYRAGLFELSKATARAVRRRALFGQLFNIIPQGNQGGHMPGLASDIALWGARLEGPDLMNDDHNSEINVYANVHRALHDKALTMIWHQNASYSEAINPNATVKSYYTPAQQFTKAKRGVDDTNTPSGNPGLEAEYVFWNMTLQASTRSDQYFVHALPVIASNPVIQTTGNNRYLWRRSANGAAIPDQTITRQN